jgi:hypothetical protein
VCFVLWSIYVSPSFFPHTVQFSSHGLLKNLR